MKTMTVSGLLGTAFSLMAIMILIGCAASNKNVSFEAEKHLVAAGFKFKVAEDDKMLARMAKLPQHRLIRHVRNEEPIWIYPDVAGCKCLYAGDEKAYKTLKEQIKYDKISARLERGTGADSRAREQAAMEELDIDDGMLPGM